MAEIDTGLGWAAQDSWLITAASAVLGTIHTIGGAAFAGQPLGEAATINDMPTASISMENISNGAYYTQIASDPGNGGQLLVFYYLNGTDKTWVIVSDSAQFTYHLCQYVPNSTEPYSNFDTTDVTNPLYDSTSGLYYWTISTQSPIVENAVPGPPEFTSFREGMDAITVTTTTFQKVNGGYSVACIAKWKTESDVVFNTPILISSISDLTDMTTDAAGIYMAKLNVLRQGVRFYMSFYDNTGSANINSNLPVLDLSGEAPKTLEQVFAYIADLDHAAILVLESPDPYTEDGAGAGEEGGDGEDLEDDPVEEETLPLPSVAGHGFCTVYVPSSQELGQMASYLWSGAYDVTQVIKLFSNPMDSILGLSAVPVELTGSPEQIYLGGVALPNITMPKYTGRTSVKVDFGTVTVKERWGSYLDYAPYTDFSIYLPFIGIKPIKADDIMGKTISLMYAIDILSGGCVAYLRPAGGSVLYEWSGQCAVQIPVTGRSYDNVFQSAMSVATATLAAVSAPASAPVLSGAVASAAVQAAATKPHIERSGTVNGITGFLGQLRPYLIRTIPEAFIPADQNKFIGYPAYINVDLSTVKGYNEVDSIHLENVTATGAELDEIETILKGGVIF